ncbi:Ribonuclease H [Weissella ceti]|uniref:Ribonuclease H n=2 Tax=Weissella TaxID=46255 RepID=A0A075U0X7_9LACO|nr:MULTISPECIES: viroplasmin family protein [Weissella]AIG66200.1 Ribonuclease H [Weissella tructae]AIM63582.1 Ribonuclease H [Weissella ceti]AIM64918.1 Ribonuclease H [Weissella ceti]
MKTYAIVGNQYEGLYTKPWSEVQKMTQTKPAPKYKGFTSRAEAQAWFDAQNSGSRSYETAYDGAFKADSKRYYIFTDGGSEIPETLAVGMLKQRIKLPGQLQSMRVAI